MAKATRSRVKRQIVDQYTYLHSVLQSTHFPNKKKNYKFIERPQPNKKLIDYVNRHFIEKESLYTNTVEYAKLH